MSSNRDNSSVVIATRSMYEDLYKLSSELLDLPYRKVRITRADAAKYFYRLLALDAEWVINIDEDAFVWNANSVTDLLAFMEKEGYVCCGCPDGGAVPIRFHNPVVPNAFFNILWLSKLRERLGSIAEIKQTKFERRFIEHTPSFIKQRATRGAYAYDMFEKYYPFFLWILNKGMKILYLDAHQWQQDQVATILKDHNGMPFLIHSWYARRWNTPAGRKRIRKVFSCAADKRLSVVAAGK